MKPDAAHAYTHVLTSDFTLLSLKSARLEDKRLLKTERVTLPGKKFNKQVSALDCEEMVRVAPPTAYLVNQLFVIMLNSSGTSGWERLLGALLLSFLSFHHAAGTLGVAQYHLKDANSSHQHKFDFKDRQVRHVQ